MKLKKETMVWVLLLGVSIIEIMRFIYQFNSVYKTDEKNRELLEENIILRSQAARRISDMMRVEYDNY